MKKIIICLVALSLILTACSGDHSKTVKVGVVGTNEAKIWEHVKNELVKEDINLEIVVFTEYSQPNPALSNGDLDLNAFQHYIFLESYNQENKDDLTVIGETYISPLGLYSSKVEDVKAISEGDTIAIPNDVTNGGRALLLLETAGLIEVDDAKGDTPTINDITANSLQLEIVEIDASQTPRSLKDVTAAVINGGVAVDADLTPAEDAIFLEQLTAASKPYVNIIVAKKSDKDDDTLNKIVSVFQSEGTKAVIAEVSRGANIPVWE